jgi:hypothetical protein
VVKIQKQLIQDRDKVVEIIVSSKMDGLSAKIQEK